MVIAQGLLFSFLVFAWGVYDARSEGRKLSMSVKLGFLFLPAIFPLFYIWYQHGWRRALKSLAKNLLLFVAWIGYSAAILILLE